MLLIIVVLFLANNIDQQAFVLNTLAAGAPIRLGGNMINEALIRCTLRKNKCLLSLCALRPLNAHLYEQETLTDERLKRKIPTFCQ
jgi:hypothetical protein